MQVTEERGQQTVSQWVYVAFAALAMLAGPVRAYVGEAFSYAVSMQVYAGEAMCGVVAGIVLAGISAARREKRLSGRQWIGLLVLLLPQVVSGVLGSIERSKSLLRGIGWGTALLLSVAAPLWLALVAALGVGRISVPRRVAGAAIAGIFAVCLVVPAEAYSVTWAQTPTLTLRVTLSVVIVATWGIAVPRLKGVSALMLAAWYIFLNAVVQGSLALLFERAAWRTLDSSSVWLPLLFDVALTACVWWLWFWLLQRMSLAAFSMGALAAWAATMISGFAALGFLNWRVDVALVIAVGAIVAALRAREADEQPTALGLGGT